MAQRSVMHAYTRIQVVYIQNDFCLNSCVTACAHRQRAIDGYRRYLSLYPFPCSFCLSPFLCALQCFSLSIILCFCSNPSHTDTNDLLCWSKCRSAACIIKCNLECRKKEQKIGTDRDGNKKIESARARVGQQLIERESHRART